MDETILIALIQLAQGTLTQNEFAKRCGISSSNLTRIYRHEQKPSPDLLKKIANASNDDPSYEDLMVAAGYWEKEKDTLFMPVKGLFNYRCAKLRKEHNYSFDDLSKITEIDIETLRSYEADLLPTRPKEIIALARAYNVNPGYITGETPYRNYTDEIHAFERADVLADRVTLLRPETAEQFVLVLNRVISRIRTADSNKGEPPFPFINTFLRTIYGMSELLVEMSQYKCLEKIIEHDQHDSGNKANKERQELERNEAIVAKNAELIASIRQFFDDSKEFWIDTSEQYFNTHYEEIVKYFSLDDDSEGDWRSYNIEKQTF